MGSEMRIQLIHPPIYTNPNAVQATRPSLPLGLAYIAAALREAGHHVSLLDALERRPDQLTREGDLQYYGMHPEEIAAALDPAADAFGLTVLFSFSWPLARQIVFCIKERFPGIPLVAGGEHVTGMPEYSLRNAPLDYLILGEGEDTAAGLFAALENGGAIEGVPGLAFLRNGEMVMTAPRKPACRRTDPN
jgi:anaerobic magnesium-protoporphyrin IX monomethyl ester cyclase